MKNKKTIAIAMAAVTVAPMAVPTFADTTSTRKTTQVSKVDVRESEGRILGAIKHEDDVKEYFRANESKNPKTVAISYHGGVAWHAIVVDLDLTDDKNKLDQANAEILKNQMINDIKNKLGTGNYKIEIKRNPAKVLVNTNNQPYLQGASTIVYLTDTTDLNANILQYTFENVDEEVIEDEIVDIERKTLNMSSTGENKTITHKQLAEVIYELKQAGDKIYTTTETNPAQNEIYIYVYKSDKKTPLAVLKIEDTHKIDDKLLAKLEIPVKNDFSNHWAEDTIIDAMLNDIIDTKSKVRPNESITRAEFAKILVESTCGVSAFNSDVHKENFTDVNKEDWYYKYVAILACKGNEFINGYLDGTFRPNQPITRQEAAKVLAKLHDVLNDGKGNIETGRFDMSGNFIHNDIKTKYDDDSIIAAWADESVKYLTDNNIVNGYKEENKELFKPSDEIKRAEALTMVFRAFPQKKYEI